MFWNPMYLIFSLPALLLGLYAQARIRSAYQRGLRIPNRRGMSGAEAARYLLRAAGLEDVHLDFARGTLSDHYDPRTRQLRLSSGVARSASVGALSIVAHEVGHAIQDARNYGPMRIRSGLVPVVNLGSWLGPILFLAGWFLSSYGAIALGRTVAWVGVMGFAMAAVFTLVTLPVEFNASRRAIQLLQETELVAGENLRVARKVLNAAALTYVAALVQAVSTLLYYVFLLGGTRRRD
jgi:hypothetical protein